MKEIPLTKGYVTLVDDEDFDRVKSFNWWVSEAGNGYLRAETKIKGKNVRLHRYILNLTDSKIMVDHKNRNPLDNRRENLRICTKSDNQRNANKNIKKSSKYKGVCWSKEKKKWLANITVNYKTLHLGYYFDEISAARAYNKAALEYHKEFALLNKFKD